MGCGSSAPQKKEGEGLFQAELDAWWAAEGKDTLHAAFMESDFEDKKKWADHFVGFVDASLKGLEHVKSGSERAKEITTKQEYIDEYKKKIVGRENVDPANLFQIKQAADQALASAADNKEIIKNKPKLTALLRRIMKEREALFWSQGSIGPQVHTADFLKQYANAMLSDSLWTQPEAALQPTFSGRGKQFLESGIWFCRAGTEYPLHYHEALEAYYCLWGETRFVQMIDGKLVYVTRKAGEWFCNPPWVPHAIVTPKQSFLCLWFREGGIGCRSQNKYRNKWIGDVDGLEMLSADEVNLEEKQHDGVASGEVKRHNSDKELVGSLGFKPGSVSKADTDKFLRVLTPSQWEHIHENEEVLKNINQKMTPERMAVFEQNIAKLKENSQKAPVHV